MKTANLNIQTDEGLKKQAESIFEEIGINMTTAITANIQTLAAIEDVRCSRNLSGPFNRVKDFMKDLNTEDELFHLLR